MTEVYIITFEDGRHFISYEITQNDLTSFDDGLISIIRLSDLSEMTGVGEFKALDVWK